MSKKNKKTDKISVDALIGLFQHSPEEAYKKLIGSGMHTSPDAVAFWKRFNALDFYAILEHSPQSYGILLKTGHLQLFAQLREVYSTSMKACVNRIVRLNPDPPALIKAMVLALELGQEHPDREVFPNYSYEAIVALKDVLKKVIPQLSPTERAMYSMELFNDAKLLLQLAIDCQQLRKFREIYERAGFELRKREDGSGYELGVPEEGSEDATRYVLNDIKNRYKRSHQQAESKKEVSEEAHFKQVDPLFKTDEGLVTLLYSGGKIIEQTPGTTGMEVDPGVMEKLISPDEQERNEAMKEIMLFTLTQSFHVNLRRALTGIYQPNDDIPLHQLSIEVRPGVKLSLYELFCATSCLIGMADGFRYLGQVPQTGEIHSVKHACITCLKEKFPDKSPEELMAESDRYIVQFLPEIEKEHHPFCILDKETIIRYFRRIEELKAKSGDELEGLLEFMSGLDNGLPFNLLYNVGESYLFAYKACYVGDLNRMVYDHFVTEKLFNSGELVPGSKQAMQVGENHRGREKRFNASVKRSLSAITPFVECGLEFPKNSFAELSGEVDVLAYFKEENILMPIQVKLSNTSIHSEKRKEIWVDSHIRGKALTQVSRDSQRVLSAEGVKLIAETLSIEDQATLAKARLYPLIVTDNFYVDHERFRYNHQGDQVICISYFELDHLLRDLKIDKRQESWDPIRERKSAGRLIAAIESNVFWNFLKPFSQQKKKIASLHVINQENRIHLVI